jgi:hypothetical protein
VESFALYYEKFSLNPRNWFMSKEEKLRIREQDIEMRKVAMRHARENFKKMKDLLASKGYRIHKHDFSYTVRGDKKVGMEPPRRDKIKIGDRQLDIPYLKTLFTMAHEVGHVLQWDDSTNNKHKFDEFYLSQLRAEIDNGYNHRLNLEHIHKVWYELDAWIQGMQFIPMEYKQIYKKYAFDAYKTYMNRGPKYYYNDMLLRTLLIKLNAKDHF